MKQQKGGNIMMEEYGKKYPFLFGLCAFLIMYIAIKLLHFDTDLAEALKRYVCSILMLLVLWPVMKNSFLKFPGTGWKKSLWLSKGLIIFAIIMFCVSTLFPLVLQLISTSVTLPPEAKTRGPIPDGVPGRILMNAFMYLSVGIAEEIAFRLGLFVCSCRQFSKNKNHVLAIAVITSLFFGAVHVLPSVTADPVAILSSVLKTLETGSMGFIMCGAIYSTHNLWPAALIHAFGDFLPTLGNAIWNETDDVGYVFSSGDMKSAVPVCILYVISILIYLPGIIRTVKELRKEKEL